MDNVDVSDFTSYDEIKPEYKPELTDDDSVPVSIEKKKRKSRASSSEAQVKALELGRQKLAEKRALQREERAIREDPMLKSMRKLLEESSKTIQELKGISKLKKVVKVDDDEVDDNNSSKSTENVKSFSIEKTKPLPLPTPIPTPPPPPPKPRRVFI